MSFWLKLCDQLINKVHVGGIFGFNGHIWATTPGYKPRSKEFREYHKAFNPASYVLCNGITFHGELYLITRIHNNLVICKHGSRILILARCPRCIVFGAINGTPAYDEETCRNAVEKVAEIIRETPDEQTL